MFTLLDLNPIPQHLHLTLEIKLFLEN